MFVLSAGFFNLLELSVFLKILKFLNHNHWAAIASLLLLLAAFYFYGCQSTVPSMLDPSRAITRSELQIESDYLLGQVQIKLEDLDRQDAIRLLISDQAALFASTGTVNPLGLVNLAVSIFAVGSALDSKRKLKAVNL